MYARDEFLYELLKVQFPWEDASTRTVLVAHHKINIFQPGADGPAMQESFVDIPAAYLVRHEESWAGLDAQGRFTQLMARTSEPWLGRSSESNITRDGEFFKSIRIFPGGREERSMSNNEMEVDLERIWYWPQIWLGCLFAVSSEQSIFNRNTPPRSTPGVNA